MTMELRLTEYPERQYNAYKPARKAPKSLTLNWDGLPYIWICSSADTFIGSGLVPFSYRIDGRGCSAGAAIYTALRIKGPVGRGGRPVARRRYRGANRRV